MNASEYFIEAAASVNVDAATAKKALAKFIEVGLISIDPCNGEIIAKTGDVYLAVNLRHAASL